MIILSEGDESMFKSEIINQFIDSNKHSFIENVFKSFLVDKYQYIRELLSVSKEVDIKELKQQIHAYSRVVTHLQNESFEVCIKDYTNEEFYEKTEQLLVEADEFLKNHIDERVVRYQSIIEVSNVMITLLEKRSTEADIEAMINQYKLGDIDAIQDGTQKHNFYTILFRILLRVLRSEDKKIALIKDLIGEDVLYHKKVKCLHVKETKPVIISDVSSFLKIIQKMDKLFYRGHSSAAYKMIPSVYRDGLFFFEDQLIKEMMLELPEEFTSTSTHYDKMLKMQHYGIPTKLLDITSNPLVALFMACDGDEHSDGEVLLIEEDSFDVCYPSSDRVKILTSVPFLPYSAKITLAYLLSRDDVNNQLFNQLAKALLHEIKHEMPAFEARMEKEDLEKHLFVLGPKKNKRIYAQSGHFIIAPLTLRSFDSTPVQFAGDENRLRVLIPTNAKKQILEELQRLNISRSTMYPEIEHVANQIKSTYL